MAEFQITGRIIHIERLNCSVNGNPRFQIVLADGFSRNTMSDCAFNYEIGNSGFRIGDDVTLTIGRKGRGNTITGIEKA